MKTFRTLMVIGMLCAGVAAGCRLAGPPPEPTPVTKPTATQIPVNSFDTCVAAGNPVMESYPQQCRAADGTLYIEDIGNELDKLDLIRVDAPRPNAVIQSPLQIEGQARGTWFFEADFPIELLDAEGQVIGTAIATAQGEWMTEEFVPFTATLTFTDPAEGTGTLILIKDNPSDLEELDDSLEIPVKFGP